MTTTAAASRARPSCVLCVLFPVSYESLLRRQVLEAMPDAMSAESVLEWIEFLLAELVLRLVADYSELHVVPMQKDNLISTLVKIIRSEPLQAVVGEAKRHEVSRIVLAALPITKDVAEAVVVNRVMIQDLLGGDPKQCWLLEEAPEHVLGVLRSFASAQISHDKLIRSGKMRPSKRIVGAADEPGMAKLVAEVLPVRDSS